MPRRRYLGSALDSSTRRRGKRAACCSLLPKRRPMAYLHKVNGKQRTFHARRSDAGQPAEELTPSSLSAFAATARGPSSTSKAKRGSGAAFNRSADAGEDPRRIPEAGHAALAFGFRAASFLAWMHALMLIRSRGGAFGHASAPAGCYVLSATEAIVRPDGYRLTN